MSKYIFALIALSLSACTTTNLVRTRTLTTEKIPQQVITTTTISPYVPPQQIMPIAVPQQVMPYGIPQQRMPVTAPVVNVNVAPQHANNPSYAAPRQIINTINNGRTNVRSNGYTHTHTHSNGASNNGHTHNGNTTPTATHHHAPGYETITVY